MLRRDAAALDPETQLMTLSAVRPEARPPSVLQLTLQRVAREAHIFQNCGEPQQLPGTAPSTWRVRGR